MVGFRKIEDIVAWQKARKLTRYVYKLTEYEDFSKDFVLKNQLRKTSISIMSNIAEGFERSGSKEFLQFLSIAKGSLGELISHLYICHDQGFIPKHEFSKAYEMSMEVIRLVSGLISYLKNSKLKGFKFVR